MTKVSASNIRICLISPLGYTGIAYYDHCLSQSLCEIGINVTLITSKNRTIYPNKISYKIIKLFINTYGNISRLKKGLFYVLAMIRTYFYVIDKKFKIVHFQILELPLVDLAIFVLLKISRIKIVYTPHDIYSFKFKYNNKLLSIFYRLSNIIVVHNLANKDLLIKQFNISPDKIKIVIHGNYNPFLDPTLSKYKARQRIGIPKGKKVILLFGSIRPGKGIETVIKALKLIKNKTNILLLIAGKPGSGYRMETIEKEINEKNLKDNVILRDHFIEDRLVESYYKSSDVVIVPYEFVYESGVLRYAFSCGSPTVISNLKEFSEFAENGKNCLTFKSGNPADLAKKITVILGDFVVAQKIAFNAKKLSDNEWNWEKSAYETKKIYEKLLRKDFNIDHRHSVCV